jgi:divalent metal cation (Fe/Co/Zn/Cd) transporter
MDFEQMQFVWDEQKQRQVFALDLEALHESVRSRGRRIERSVESMEIGMILISSFMVVFFSWESFAGSGSGPDVFAAAVLLAVVVYLVAVRLRRRARERSWEPSLLGDLDHALAQVDYSIQSIRTMPLWFFAPALATVIVTYAAAWERKPSWLWLLVLAAFPLGIYVSRIELRCLHLPRKRELEALRAKLTAES